jgi:peptidoglycan/LPS O-acetylase OafA/YrhL
MKDIPKISDALSSFLNFLRGISAQLVVIGHLLSVYGLNNSLLLGWEIQNLGVMVFFILSGFLIFYTAFAKGEKYGIVNFLIDRTSRIFTPLVPGLILVVVLDYFILKPNLISEEHWNYSMPDFLYTLLLIQNHPIFLFFFDSGSFGSGRPLWTVSVEWIFYLCFAILFYWNRISSKVIPILVLIFLMLTPLYYISGRGGGLTIYWIFGVLVSVLYVKNIRVTNSVFGAVLIIIFSIIAFVYRGYFMGILDFYDVGLALCLAIAIYGATLTFVSNKSFFGRFFIKTKLFNDTVASFSYSLYLIHYTLIYVMFFLFEGIEIKYSLMFNFIVVNIVSYLFYWTFERHYPKVKYILHKLYVNRLTK